MRYLKLRKLRGVSVRELLRAVNSGTARGLVGLTFDDGYENFMAALPVLERFGFSATLFVLASMPKENDWEHDNDPRPQMKLLGAERIREVAARGIEVASHGMSHVRLPNLEPALLQEEVSGSRRLLSEALGEEVTGFCYPYGNIDSAATQAVRKAGYAYACTIDIRVVRNAYDLPRINMDERDDLLRFAIKLEAFSQNRLAERILRRMPASVSSQSIPRA